MTDERFMLRTGGRRGDYSGTPVDPLRCGEALDAAALDELAGQARVKADREREELLSDRRQRLQRELDYFNARAREHERQLRRLDRKAGG